MTWGSKTWVYCTLPVGLLMKPCHWWTKNFQWLSSTDTTAAALSSPNTPLYPGKKALDDIFVEGFSKTNYTCIFDTHITDVHMKLHYRKKPAMVSRIPRRKNTCRHARLSISTSCHWCLWWRECRVEKQEQQRSTSQMCLQQSWSILTWRWQPECRSIPPPPRYLYKMYTQQDGSGWQWHSHTWPQSHLGVVNTFHQIELRLWNLWSFELHVTPLINLLYCSKYDMSK